MALIVRFKIVVAKNKVLIIETFAYLDHQIHHNCLSQTRDYTVPVVILPYPLDLKNLNIPQITVLLAGPK